MSDYYCILTPEGRNKLARAALLNQPLAIDRMAAGDGNPLEIPPAGDQADLVHEVYRAPLNKLYSPEEDSSVVIAEMAIPTTAGGWQVNEISLIDDEGSVIAIGNYPMTWKPPYTSGTGRVLLIRIMLDVTNATDIRLIIDPAAVMASEQHVRLVVDALREHVDQPTGIEAGTYTKVRVNVRGQVVEGWNPTTLAGYGIVNAYTSADVDWLLSKKANNAITLGGYGITDAYTKPETDWLLSQKANNAITLGGYGIGDAYTKTEVNTQVSALQDAIDDLQEAVDDLAATKQDKNTALMAATGWRLDKATGFLEQWGSGTVGTDTISPAIDFPTPFAEVYNCFGNKITAQPEDGDGNSAGAFAISATQYKLFNDTNNFGAVIHWRAIGKAPGY